MTGGSPPFDALLGASSRLLAQANGLDTAYREQLHMPLNFKLLAAEFGRDGAAMAVVAASYNEISIELRSSIARVVKAAAEVFDTVSNGLFLIGIARVQQEVMSQFRAEADHTAVSAEAEIAVLNSQQRAYTRDAFAGQRLIAERVTEFQRDCTKFARLAATLELTRIMSQVECARLQLQDDTLAGMLNALEDFQKIVIDGLAEIAESNQRIQRASAELKRLDHAKV